MIENYGPIIPLVKGRPDWFPETPGQHLIWRLNMGIAPIETTDRWPAMGCGDGQEIIAVSFLDGHEIYGNREVMIATNSPFSQ